MGKYPKSYFPIYSLVTKSTYIHPMDYIITNIVCDIARQIKPDLISNTMYGLGTWLYNFFDGNNYEVS